MCWNSHGLKLTGVDEGFSVADELRRRGSSLPSCAGLSVFLFEGQIVCDRNGNIWVKKCAAIPCLCLLEGSRVMVVICIPHSAVSHCHSSVCCSCRTASRACEHRQCSISLCHSKLSNPRMLVKVHCCPVPADSSQTLHTALRRCTISSCGKGSLHDLPLAITMSSGVGSSLLQAIGLFFCTCQINTASRGI